MRKFFFVCLSTLLIISSCSQTKSPRISLIDGWQYSVNNANANDYQELATEDLNALEKIVPNGKGFIWLKKNFVIPQELKNQELSIYLGRITMADKTYVNNTLIGSTGRFPPNEWSEWTKARLYYLPDSLIKDNNEILVEIWVGGEGSIVSNPFIGLKEDAKSNALRENFWNADINLIFAFIMVLIAFYQLVIFIKMKEGKETLVFALLNFVSAAYLSVFYISEVPGLLSDKLSFLWFQKIFSSGMPFVIAFILTSFVKFFLKQKEKLIITIIRIIFLIIPFTLVLISPDYQILRNMKIYTQLLALPPVLYSLYLLISSLIKKNKEALTLVWGFSPMVFTAILDIVLHEGLKLYHLPYFLSLGWQIVIISLLFVLANRFANAKKEADDLNIHLENKVSERTKELSFANQQLSLAQQRSERDMKLAVNVQQSFYPNKAPKSASYDIAFSFRPMSGVSGDLYDFYCSKGQLLGLGLFDVSGHGIAAGLVTMLSKNIITRQFINSINSKSGKPISLANTMSNIDKEIALAKGNIENYLTGLLLRFSENKVEYVSAGHPPIVYRNAKTGKTKTIELETESSKGGILGILGMEGSFKTIAFEMKKGDSLLLYTDGISEAKNTSDEFFGKERISATFSIADGISSQEKLSTFMNRFDDFTRNCAQADDITAIVIVKT